MRLCWYVGVVVSCMCQVKSETGELKLQLRSTSTCIKSKLIFVVDIFIWEREGKKLSNREIAHKYVWRSLCINAVFEQVKSIYWIHTLFLRIDLINGYYVLMSVQKSSKGRMKERKRYLKKVREQAREIIQLIDTCYIHNQLMAGFFLSNI